MRPVTKIGFTCFKFSPLFWLFNVGLDLTHVEPTRAARAISDFVQENLSNWYVRLCRRRFWKGEYGQDKIAAYQTLYECLLAISKLGAPIAPFFMDKLYRDLTLATQSENFESVHLADFPRCVEKYVDKSLESKMEKAQIISSLVLSLRKKEMIKVRQPLQKIMIPILEESQRAEIEAVSDLIKAEVNVKEIELIEARKEAERQATSVRVSAEAEKMAAEDKAEALRMQANAEADAIRARVEADREKYKVDAEGQQLMNEALNSLSEAQIALKRVLSLHEHLPMIIRESVKPLENIDGMKIISIDGMTGFGERGTTGILNASAEGSQSLPEALVDSALKHRAMAPLVDSLLKEAGVADLAADIKMN